MFITTKDQMYDAQGNWLGYRVIEVSEAFTPEELRQQADYCRECGGVGGVHRSYFVKTGQSLWGDVEGFNRECSWKGKPTSQAEVASTLPKR